MSTAQLKRIAVAVGALLVLWLGVRLLPSGTDRPAAGFRLPPLSADSADSVVIVAAGDTIAVARGPDRWTANGFAASSTAVADFFTALGAPTAELVAQRAASFEPLGVDSGAARRVRVVQDGRVAVDLLVSEQEPDLQTAHARTPGDSSVYALRGRFAVAARRGLDDWRDKTVATVAPDSVHRIELRRGRGRTLLRRQPPGWRLAGGATADTSAVRSLLERYRTITATGFPTAAQRDSTFRGPVERQATLRDASGTVLLALEFDSTRGGFWVRGAGAADAPVFRLSSWLVDALVPADSTLR